MRAKRKVSARRRPGLSGIAAAVAQYRGAERIRHHQATFLRDEHRWKPARHGEVETIGKLAISRPLLVCPKIGHRAFDLDDHQVAALAEGHNIGAATIGEREFDQTGIPELVQGTANPACQ